MKSGTNKLSSVSLSCPTEVALANGDTFSINASTSTHIAGYNMIIIPEAG